MGKSLVKRLRDTALVLTAVATLEFASCELPVSNPVPLAPKVTTLTASPTSGKSPLESRIQLEGENGTYELDIDAGEDGTIDYTKTQSTPFADFSYSFDKPSIVHGKVISPSGAVDTKSIRIDVAPNIPVNHAPVAYLNLNPNSGAAPLITNIKLIGTDADGDIIATYGAFADYNKNRIEDSGEELVAPQSTPIDISKTFDSTTDIFGWVKDSHGAKSVQVSQTANVTPPNIPVNHAPLVALIPNSQINEGAVYGGQVIATDEDGDTLTYSLKNNYPNWLSIDSTGHYTGTALKVNSSTSPSDIYDIEFDVSDGKVSVPQTSRLTVNNLVDVEGYVKNNKTGLPQKGRVKIFNSADVNFTNPLGEVGADTTGYFIFHSTKKVSELSGVGIRAILADPSGNQISYARTVRVPAGDVSGLTIKPHPDPTFATREQFKEHMRKTNISTSLMIEIDENGNTIERELGLEKWDLEGKIASENALKGIVIFSNYNGSSFTTGSGSQYEIIQNKIKNSNDIETCIKGSSFNSGELDNLIYDSSSNIGYDTNNGSLVQLYPGYILVIPDNSLGSNIMGITHLGYKNNLTTGIINRAIIRIKPSIGNGNDFKKAVSHEFEHVFDLPYDLPLIVDSQGRSLGDSGYQITYDSQTLLNPLTILRYDTSNTTLGEGEADKEDPYIINGDTYLPRERLDDILGTIF